MIKDSPALGELTKLGGKHTGKFSNRWPGNGGPQSGHPMQFGGQVHITVTSWPSTHHSQVMFSRREGSPRDKPQ